VELPGFLGSSVGQSDSARARYQRTVKEDDDLKWRKMEDGMEYAS
jgi:hypothetical protein